jgi:hypothetical protein
MKVYFQCTEHGCALSYDPEDSGDFLVPEEVNALDEFDLVRSGAFVFDLHPFQCEEDIRLTDIGLIEEGYQRCKKHWRIIIISEG